MTSPYRGIRDKVPEIVSARDALDVLLNDQDLVLEVGPMTLAELYTARGRLHAWAVCYGETR